MLLNLAINTLRQIEECEDLEAARSLARLVRQTLEMSARPEPEPLIPRSSEPYVPQTDFARKMGDFGDWMARQKRDIKGEAKQAILDCLRTNPKASYDELRRVTGYRDVNRLLNELGADGLIERGHGYNRVIDGHEPAPEKAVVMWYDGRWQEAIMQALGQVSDLSIEDLKVLAGAMSATDERCLNRAIKTLGKRGLIQERRECTNGRAYRYISPAIGGPGA
jgi:DNA-binding HxlR family transcriptional regulator